jgi:hypothetical protein
MTTLVSKGPIALLAAGLLASALLGNAAIPGPLGAPPSAGPLRASAVSILFLGETPANGALLGLLDPVTYLAVAYVDAAPNATITAVDFHLDGMNLTSAGSFTDTTFTMAVGFAFRDGPHFANFTLLDSYGGVGYHNWTFTVDTIPPVVVLTSPAYPVVPVPAIPVAGTAFPALPQAAPVGITVTVLPSHASRSMLANVSTGAFSLLMPLAQGANVIFVNATDAAGNPSTTITSVVSDTVPPPLVVLTPANLSVSPTNLVRVSGLSEFGAFVTVNGYTVIVAPNGTWGVVLALPEGLNILQIAAADQVGNLNYTGVVVLVDSDVPQVTLTSPRYSLTNDDHVVVSGSVTDTMLGVLLVNGAAVSVAADGSFSTTLTLPEGLDPIVVVAVDAAQHITTVRTEVRVDTTPPVLAIASPPDGLETNASSATVRGTVDDVNATVLVNGLMVRPDASGEWQATVALLPGGNLISVSAVDVAGNRASPLFLHIDYFSPIPALQNGTAATQRSLDEQAAILRFSLVGIVLLFTGVTLVLYSRLSRRVRDDRRVIAELVRRMSRKP